MKININNFLISVLAFCIILECETVWKWINHSGVFKIIVFLISSISLILLVFNEQKVKKAIYSKKMVASLFVLLIYFVIFVIINISSSVFNVLQFVIISFLMFYYLKNTKNTIKLFEKISKYLLILSLISLLFFSVGSLFKIMPTSNSIVIFVNNLPKICKSYFYLHYEIQREATFGIDLYRNTGIFYEAPKYNLILSVVLMYELYIVKGKRFLRTIILSLTILTTFSLTGIYGLVLIWGGYLLCKYSIKTKKGLFIKYLLLIILILSFPMISTSLGKMQSIKSGTASYSTRMDNYIAGYKSWIESPIIGHGFLDMNNIKKHYSSFRLNDIGYSNSIFRVLSQGGIFLLLLYIVPIVVGVKKSLIKKNYYILMFIMVFIYLFLTTSFPYNYITILILCLFLNPEFEKDNIGKYIGGRKNEI